MIEKYEFRSLESNGVAATLLEGERCYLNVVVVCKFEGS